MLLRELLSFPLYFIFHVFDLPLSVLRELRLEVYGSPHSINWTLGLAAGSLPIWGLSGSKVKGVPSPLPVFLLLKTEPAMCDQESMQGPRNS